jgi:hypothetical protein
MSGNGEAIGAVQGGPKMILRLEGLVVLIGAAVAYHAVDGNWWLFAILFLVPDISMLGYLSNPALGAKIYNLGHSYVLPAILLAIFLSMGHPLGVAIAIIWIAHIGFDRFAGYGLKYESAFGATHLGRIGRK